MSEGSWGSWWEQTQRQAKTLASQAQSAAAEVSKRYEIEKHASALLGLHSSSTGEPQHHQGEEVELSSLDFSYVTENVVAMGFPCDKSKRKMKSANDINIVSKFLSQHHKGRFMIWNVSEDSYDYSKFDDQVLEYKFPGHPAPPLGLMFKICTSVESWTDADPRNVAIIHCLTGKGRTAVIIACILTWMGEFLSPMEALQYTANRRNVPVETLTIPSQRRYIQYFSNVLDGVKPRAEPLLLRRIIMNGTPGYCSDPTWKDSNHPSSDDAPVVLGCCPYIQLFKNGRLMASALATTPSIPPSENGPDTSHADDKKKIKDEVRWVSQNEGCISFQVDCICQGDVLIRCRHFDDNTGARVSMFRAAFHTGYVPSGVLRLTKAQLDGPNSDDRFHEDFFIDLIFAPVETNKELTSAKKSSSEQLPPPPSSDSGVVLDAQSTDKFEQMLHRDARFWENISDRKIRSKKRKSRKFASTSTDKFSIFDGADMAREKSREELNKTYEVGSLNYVEEDGDDLDDMWKSDTNDLKYDKDEHGDDGGISDQELINQLAQAEFDVEEYDSSKQEKNIDQNTTSITATNRNQTEASKELQALEDLEKELGLDFDVVSASSCSDTDGKEHAIVEKAKPTEEESSQSLDDLEDFLESLNT